MTISDKIRIYELSRDLNLDNKDILDAAQKLSISVKSHSSSISAQEAKKIKNLINKNSDKKIPLIDSLIPKSYKICIKPTSLSESSYSALSSGEGKPGIYILYSNPEKGVSVNATPVRRIFCRPKPFCKL